MFTDDNLELVAPITAPDGCLNGYILESTLYRGKEIHVETNSIPLLTIQLLGFDLCARQTLTISPILAITGEGISTIGMEIVNPGKVGPLHIY